MAWYQESFNLNSLTQSLKMYKKILITIGILTSIIFLMGTEVQAYSIPNEFRPQNEPFSLKYGEGPVQGSTATIQILQIIAGGLLYFAVPVAVIIISIAGLQMVTGGAESEKLEESKKNLTWAVIGLILIILSYSAVKFVISFIFNSANKEALPPPASTTTEVMTSYV